jgi:hypothetical protein
LWVGARCAARTRKNEITRNVSGPTFGFEEKPRVTDNRLNGVWIRDGSSKVLVRDNEIRSGRGPGIAVGGLHSAEAPWKVATGVAGLDIVSNQIIGMGNSGIVTADRGAQRVKELGGIEDITIADNTIVRCGWRPPPGWLERRASGGIVLSEASGVRIHGNRITNNGVELACGVFLYGCEDLDVVGNEIEENGGASTDNFQDWEMHLAIQAGICALYASGISVGAISSPPEADGRRAFMAAAPAASIRDSIVVTPGGPALVVTAAGSVSLTGNSLISYGAMWEYEADEHTEAEEYHLKQMLQGGPCVFVYDVGLAPQKPDSISGGDLPSLPDGRVHFHGNQVTLQAGLEVRPPASRQSEIVPLSAGAVVLFSGDDISLHDNQVLTEIGGGTMFANVMALAPTVRASGNRFTELPGQALFSYLAVGDMGSSICNQTTHCLFTWTNDAVHPNNQALISEPCTRLEQKREG